MSDKIAHTTDRHRLLNAINSGRFTQLDTGGAWKLLQHGLLPSRGDRVVVQRLIAAGLAGPLDNGNGGQPGTKRPLILTTDGVDALFAWDVLDPRWVGLLDTTWTYDRNRTSVVSRHIELRIDATGATQEDLDRAAEVITAALNERASWADEVSA